MFCANFFVFVAVLFACQEETNEPIQEIRNPPKDTLVVPLKNLALSANVSTLHPALFNRRFSKNATDGVAGNNADNGWVPRVENISNERPVLFGLSWDKLVMLVRVICKGYQNWSQTNFLLVPWESNLHK